MKKRIYSINADVLRIIAGFAVVFIHATDPFLIYPPYYGVGGLSYLVLSFLNAASRICVPLFILLSGYLLLKPEKTIKFKDFYIRRATRVLIPFIFWLFMYFIFLAPPISIKSIFTAILSSNIGVLYFLIIIIELYLITPFLLIFLQKFGKKSRFILFIASILLTLSLNLVNNYFPHLKIQTNNNILTIFIPYISYYLGGYYLRNINLTSTQKILTLFIFWVVLVFTVLSTDNTSVSVINTNERQFDSINVLIMSMLAFIFFINNSFIKQKLSRPFIISSIKLIAGSIFGIYLIHPFILRLLNNNVRLNPGNIYSPMMLFIFIKTFAILLISFFIVALGRRIPLLKLIFGE